MFLYSAYSQCTEFYTLKWNSKEKLQYAPNIVASTRWFNQIIFWVQKDILNEKNLSKRTEILSHFIRIAKKLVDINNFSSAMAVVSALNVQCIYRLSATWSNLCSRDRHTFRKLADLFSQEQNYLNLRSAVDNARLPCIPYLAFVRNEFIASYLEAQRYIEELQRFIEDANYKLSIQLEPLPPPPDPSFSTVPPNYSFLNNNNNYTNNNNGNNYVLKPVPIHNCSANVSSNCDTTTTSLSSVKTTSSLSPLSCKTPTVNSNNNISVKHTNKDIADHSSPNSTPNQRKKQSKSISPLCDLIAPPAIPPPPPHVKRTHFQEDMSIQSGHHHLNTEFFAGNSVQRPRKRPTHRRLGSWAGVGLLSCDNYLTPSVEKCVHHAKQIVDKSESKQKSTLSTHLSTTSVTSSSSSSHPLFRSPNLNRNSKSDSTKQYLSNLNNAVVNKPSPGVSHKYTNNRNFNSKPLKQLSVHGNLTCTLDDHPSSHHSSSLSSPHLPSFTDCLNNSEGNNNNLQSIRSEQKSSSIIPTPVQSPPLSSPTSLHNSAMELQCMMASKLSINPKYQSSYLPNDVYDFKTTPVTPYRRIKEHSDCDTRLSCMPMPNFGQENPTTDNSTSNEKITRQLFQDSSFTLPTTTSLQSSFMSSQTNQCLFSNCTPLANRTDSMNCHCRLSQTFPLLLPTSKIRSSSLHSPKLLFHHNHYQHQPSTYLTHLALAALATVQVIISDNDYQHTKNDENISVDHCHYSSVASPLNFSRSKSSTINSASLNTKLTNRLEVIREGPLLCCSTSLTSFQSAKSRNVSISKSLQSTPFTDYSNIPLSRTFANINPLSPKPCHIQENYFESPTYLKKLDFQADINHNHLPDTNSSLPTFVDNPSISYSQASLPSVTVESTTSLSSLSSAPSSCHHSPNDDIHEDEQSVPTTSDNLYPEYFSINCNCKYMKKSLFSGGFYKKKFKHYWAVLLISYTTNLSSQHQYTSYSPSFDNHDDECAFLVLFKTRSKHFKQLLPWSTTSSIWNQSRIQLLNSPNYYSANRCRVLRIEDTCFESHHLQQLNSNCIHPTVLVLDVHSNKQKVYRLMHPTTQYLSIHSMMYCKSTNQFDAGLNSIIQVTNNTHRLLLPSWSWTTKTIHRFSQAIKQKFTTTSKTFESKCHPTIPLCQYSSPNRLLQWLPLLSVFPVTSKSTSPYS
ncbi:Ras-specific guanine nucleotide-releasing factor RalGPS1 [Schistosoma japonicum]|nr:Ras-specific guanine nucleotide-releasing factor RalGPS1 [Schistosoma japonicum]KAH8856026.1 Ras-specific guanine nucleotide-releasing factor RalGPS1 [Schistosoma japonicum]